jgi:hypothetical protein
VFNYMNTRINSGDILWGMVSMVNNVVLFA